MNLGNGKFNGLSIDGEKKYILNEIDLNNNNCSQVTIIKNITDGSKVLDVGCSYGYIGNYLAENKNCKVYGIEIDKEACLAVEKQGKYEKVINADLENLQNNEQIKELENDFDFVIFADVLEHLRNPKEVILELSEKLKYGGGIIISIPNISNLDIIINLMMERFNYSQFGILDNTHLRFFTCKSFMEWVYLLNKDLGEFKFDFKFLQKIFYETEFIENIKTNYKYLYNEFSKTNDGFNVVQNLFLLTKIKSQDIPYGLIDGLINIKGNNKIFYINDVAEKSSSAINRLESYNYKFKIQYDNIKYIDLKFATYDKRIQGNLYIGLMKDEKIINKVVVDMNMIDDNTWKRISFEVENLEVDHEYEIFISTESDEENSISVWTNNLGKPCLAIIYNNKNDEYILEDVLEIDKVLEPLNNKFREVNDVLVEKVSSYERQIELYKKQIENIKQKEEANKLKYNELLLQYNSVISTKGWIYLDKLRRVRNKFILPKQQNLSSNSRKSIYEYWIEKNEPSKEQLDNQRLKKFSYEPLISVIVPTYNTPQKFLIEMIESVTTQTYSNWELCIADGASKEKYIEYILKQYSSKDSRIKYKILLDNKGIAENTNEAIKIATGDYISLLDHDDILPANALFEVVEHINKNVGADFIYSDEDKITEDGAKRYDPHFKPDWSPDNLRSQNYICHFTIIKRDLLEKVGYFREGFNGSQDYDLFLRATEKAENIIHIPKILYHWRFNQNSVAADPTVKMYAYDSAKKALKEHLNRLNLSAEVKDGMFLGSYNVQYELVAKPKVSIIIPNKDHIEDLKRCLDSVVKKSTYSNYEIIIVENNSTELNTFKFYEEISNKQNIKVVKWDGIGFNYSAINNFGAKAATGEILLLLNNDIEIITNDWIEQMLCHMLRKDIGIVGAKLYYPDDTIQHAGVIIGIGGIAGHHHKCFKRKSLGYMGRLMITQNLSAVTGACIMIKKELFSEISGLDERFAVAFNDIDLCLKVREKGYLIVWTPYVELYHYESKSRGQEDTPEKQRRFSGEIQLFRKKWYKVLTDGDPCYNPNLTLSNEDFSVKED